jgi:uncharacterized protein YjbJ (UPF0337 family)
MNKLQMKGSWNEIKGKLKQKYAQLTDEDLTFAEGKEVELLGRLQKKLGKSREVRSPAILRTFVLPPSCMESLKKNRCRWGKFQ